MPELVLVRTGRVDYHTAWDWQRALHERRGAGDAPDTVLLVEHEPVYTAGRRTDPLDRPLDGTPVVDVDRGGKITWHGHGQVTGYPIVALPPLPGAAAGDDRAERPVDVVAYVRRLEQALIGVCADLGLAAVRVAGRSGVWLPADDTRPERKVGAIGVRVARGVTMHGFALNADCDLAAFDRIVPCGIRDAGVTSLTAELGTRVGVDDVLPLVEHHVCAVFDATPAPGSLSDVGLAHTPREEASLV